MDRAVLHPHPLQTTDATREAANICDTCHKAGDVVECCPACDWDICAKCLVSGQNVGGPPDCTTQTRAHACVERYDALGGTVCAVSSLRHVFAGAV